MGFSDESHRARQVRAVRGVVATAVATTLAATAHTIGGGTAPAWWLVGAVTLLAAPIGIALIGRRPSFVRTALAASAAQAALHTASAAVGDAAPAVTAASRHLHAADSAPFVLATVTGSHVHPDVGMILTHAAAAIVTIAVLTRGETLLRLLARGVRRLLPPLEIGSLPVTTVPPMPARAPMTPRTGAFLTSISHRGPPLRTV